MSFRKVALKLGFRKSTNPGNSSASNQELSAEAGLPQPTQPDGPRGNELELSPRLEKRAGDVPIRELWDLAFERLREEDEELIADYEAKLCGNIGAGLASVVSSKIGRRELMEAVLRRKMKDVNNESWKLKFADSELQVKDVVEPVLGLVNWVNDCLTNALVSNSYASIALAGVSLLLPLVLNPSEQALSLIDGLEYISGLIAQSKMREDLYTRRYESSTSGQTPPSMSHTVYKEALEGVYRKILKFQAAGYLYYAKNAALRLGLDVVKWNGWNEMLGEIRERERNFTAVAQIWRDMKYDEECTATERRHHETIQRWDDIGVDVSGLRKAVEKAQGERKRTDLLSWLCKVDPSASHNLARDKHVSGTGDWLVRDSEQFRTWNMSPSSLLWLHGKAGSGKSILTSSVIAHLKTEYASDPRTALAYYYFSFRDESTQNTAVMLASLIKQLCARRPIISELVESFSEYKDKGERPDTNMLETALVATARGFSTVHIVIDALDECPVLGGERRKLLESLRRIIASIPDNTHLFCASRSEPDIAANLNPLLSPPSRTEVNISTEITVLHRDIGLYIDSVLASADFESWPKGLKTQAKELLNKRADGMFQYVFCQLEILRDLSSESLIHKALQDLPVGLDETYNRILLSISPESRLGIVSVLRWLTFANRFFYVEEIAEIFILHPQHIAIFDEKERLFNPLDVLKKLSVLVISSKEQGLTRVSLAHFSIREYLMSSRITQGPAAHFSLSEVEAQLHIAHSCLVYYLYCVTNDKADVMPLYDSAREFWPILLERVPRELWKDELVALVMDALSIDSPSLRGMERGRRDRLFLSGPDTPYIELANSPEYFSFPTGRPQCFTALLGFVQLTDMVLSANAYRTQEDLEEALQYAAFGGQTSVLQLLLDKGASVNAEYRPFGDALQAAAYKGRLNIALLLLDKGADINARRGGWGSAIQAATGYSSHVIPLLIDHGVSADVPCNRSNCVWMCMLQADFNRGLSTLLRNDADINRACERHGTALHKASQDIYMRRRLFYVLLDKGADVNAKGGEYGHPLQAVCNQGGDYRAEAEALLDRGADVNAEGGRFGSALQAASCARSDGGDIVKLLVERGANVNATGGRFGTALQAACTTSQSRQETIDFLLDSGADVNATGGYYGTALQAACLSGYLEAARRMLNQGANINSLGGQYGSALQAATLCPIRDKAIEVVELLLDRGADVNAYGGHYGSALQAAATLQGGECLELLLDRGADVNASGGHYGNALQAAAFQGDIKAVRMLLNCGADVNAEVCGEYGTALQAACVMHNLETVQLLLERGADVHMKGGKFGNAWHSVASNFAPKSIDVRDKEDRARWRRLRLLLLLLDHGCDINDAHGPHGTALQAVVNDTRPSGAHRLRFLIRRGANANIVRGPYGSLLQFACATPKSDCMALLLLQYCPDIDINIQGGSLGSALQAAAYRGHMRIIEELLSRGAHVNASGGLYGSALNAAIARGSWGIVDKLLAAGAIPDSEQLLEMDEDILQRFREEDSQGAIQRYIMFWDRHKGVMPSS
ncbi:ankyrin [Hypomontagnella monticulosa]|nr:ankyrin [Hypomontagnella monticulosa]